MTKSPKFTIIRPKPNCLSSIRTMLITSKIFACNLFHIPKDAHSAEQIKMTAIDYSIAVSYALLYFTFTFPFFIDMVFIRTSILLSSGNFVIIFLVRIIFFFIVIANFSCYIMEAFNKKKMWKLITKLYDFDESAKKLGLSVENNNRLYVVYSSRIVLMYITMTSICGFMLYKQLEAFWLILQFYISYIIMDGCYTSTLCLYNYYIHSFRTRFININDALLDLLNIREISKNQVDTESRKPLKELDQLCALKKLAKLYKKLTYCMWLLSECYSVQISIIVAVVFQFSLVCFYMIYRIFIGKYNMNTVLVTLAYTMRTFYFYSQILFGIVYGTRLSSDAKYTCHILNKGLNLPLKKPILNQLEYFLQQISHSNTTISCGLFSMDVTLFYTMIAAVVSYLVLFIQFDILLIATNNY